MDSKKKAAPRKRASTATNGKTTTRKRAKKDDTNESETTPSIITASQQETPKLTEQQHFDALFLPPADTTKTTTATAAKEPEVKEEDGLPDSYRELEKIFNMLVTIYMCLQGRKQSCTWTAIKAPLEAMYNQNLHVKHIAQIKTVIPDHIKLEVWKYNITTKQGTNQLAIEFSSSASSSSAASSALSAAALPAHLRETFHNNLVKIVNQHHSTFLAKNKLKAPKPPTLYHSRFNLQTVPEIAPASLPSLTDQNQTTLTNGNHQQTPQMMDAETVERYLEAKPVPAQLAGLSANTIAAAREAEELLDAEDASTLLFRRLPGVVRGLHGLCVGERKRAFPLKALEQQLVECSATPLSLNEAQEAIAKLVTLVPQWASVYRTEDDGAEWIRFSRDVPVSACMAAIKQGK